MPEEAAPEPANAREVIRCVFVYGTLRPGECNWHHLDSLTERTQPATLTGHRLYELEYPCAVGVAEADPDAGDAVVIGDLVWLRAERLDHALAHLDWFEDYRAGDPDGSLYVRERRRVTLPSGDDVESWVYLAGRPQLDRLRPEHEIPGGEWNGSSPP